MKYRQETVADKSVIAIEARLRIERKWMKGVILDKNKNIMPFPCEVKKGEVYFVEVDTEVRNGDYCNWDCWFYSFFRWRYC